MGSSIKDFDIPRLLVSITATMQRNMIPETNTIITTLVKKWISTSPH